MLGHTVVFDLFDCNPLLLNDLIITERVVKLLAKLVNAKILDISSHQFYPQGISCIAQITASHISIHTWPETKFVAIDVFSCKSRIRVEIIEDALIDVFHPKQITHTEILRGSQLTSIYFNE